MKIWEQLNAYFPFIRYGPIENHMSNCWWSFFSEVRAEVKTELLPAFGNYGGIHRQQRDRISLLFLLNKKVG